MNETDFIKELYQRNQQCCASFPDKAMAEDFQDDMFHFLFTPHEGRYETEALLQGEYSRLRDVFSSLVFELLKKGEEARAHTDRFFEAIPAIYKELMLDAESILAFDPAAKSMQEVLMAYPGFYATAVYRMSHQLHLQGVPTLPRLLSEYAHSKTGIDIHPAAVIGKSFFIDHGTGIVIGETSHIGNHVKIYQGVTLGALNVLKELASTKRHPTIEDEVIIYSGATILGGSTVVGRGSVIGGNVWLTNSVPPGSVVYHKSEVKIKDRNPFPEAIDFVI